MRFESIFYLKLLWLIPVLIVVVFYFYRRKRSLFLQSLGKKLSPVLLQSYSRRKDLTKLVFQLFTIVFAILALARPQLGQSRQEVKSEGIEIFIAVDVSDSMMAEDIKPNRLEQVKAELSKFIDQMPGHRIGLIAFAGSANVLSPLTADPAALRMYIDSLSTTSVSSQGTCIECALQEAREGFKRGGLSGSEQARVTRVLIVASDGEDHEEGALKAAQSLKEEGYKIFTLAYGTEKGGAIPVRDRMGYLRGYKKDDSGQIVISQVKGDFLKQLAQAGEGQFHFAQFGGQHLARLNEEINQLEKTQFQSDMVTQFDEKFMWFLWPALCFACFEMLMGQRKKKATRWRGRFEVNS